MISGLLALALIGVTVQVEAQSCTSSTAIQAAVAARIDLPVELTVSASQDGLEVRFLAPGHPPLVRTLSLAPEDCPYVPQMLALMTERFVRALPEHTWAARAPPAPSPDRVRLSLSLTPTNRHHRASLGIGMEAGASLGLSAGETGGYLRPHLDLGIGPNFGLSTALGLRLEPNISLANGGSVRWLAGWAGLSAFTQYRVVNLDLRAEVGMSGGLAAGTGQGFEGASSDRVPQVEGMIRLRIGGQTGLFGGLETRLNIAGPSFADYEAPRVRLGLFFGFQRDIAFF